MIIDFFSVRSNSISPNEHQKQYVHVWRYARVKIQVLVFIRETKFDLTLNPSTPHTKFSVSFIPLFTIVKLLPTLRLSIVRKLTFFLAISRQFGLVQRVEAA